MSSLFDELKYVGRKAAGLTKDLLVGQKSTALSMAKVLALTATAEMVVASQTKDETPKRVAKDVVRTINDVQTIDAMLQERGLQLPKDVVHSRHEGAPNGNNVMGAAKGPKQRS